MIFFRCWNMRSGLFFPDQIPATPPHKTTTKMYKSRKMISRKFPKQMRSLLLKYILFPDLIIIPVRNDPKTLLRIIYVVHIIMQNITWRVNFYSSKGLIWKGGKNILGVKKRCRDLVTYAYILITYWLKMFELVFSQSTFLGTGRIPPINTNGSFLEATFQKPQNSSQ